MKPNNTLAEKYKICFSHKYFVSSLVLAIGLLFASLIIDFHAGAYATREAVGTPVPDIILSNVRAYDVDGLFLYAPVVMWLFFCVLTFADPKRLPFTIKSIVLFIVVRSLFVTLTHLSPPIVFDSTLPWGIRHYTFVGDLFFSAHTGFPFLMAMLFWYHKRLRVFFICCSIFFGAVVLLGHYHYSIDVLAAFFITYAIFDISKIVFRKDYIIFNGGITDGIHFK